jgi:hypothetical protein
MDNCQFNQLKMVVIKRRRAGKITREVAKTTMMYCFMKMFIDSCAMKIISMDTVMYFRFRKRKKKNQQRENGECFFQFLHGQR